MDHTLVSLQNAFRDARYIESRRGYNLYAVLLATTLDQRFLADYLGLYEELHELTGEDVLVMGVRSGGYQPDPTPEAPLVRTFQMHAVAKVFNHTYDETENTYERGPEWAKRFLSFLQRQTAESYALARFLGIRTDQFPVMVFFEDLEQPSEMVVWPLGRLSASEFTRQFRHIIEEARGRCGWHDRTTLRRLTQVIDDYQRLTQSVDRTLEPVFWFRDEELPAEFGKTAKTLRDLRHRRLPYDLVLAVYEKIDAARTAFDGVRAISGLRVPLDSVGETIERLVATGADVHRGVAHLVAHERRWKTRLPMEYRQAVGALKHGATRHATGRNLPSRGETAEKAAGIDVEIVRILEEQERLRQAVQKRLELIPRTLSVIEDVLRIRSCPLGDGAPPRDAFTASRATTVPRVFISYSHDSAKHAAAVLDLAQHLRDDGVDCWIDQFESSPAAGFPRWMREQVQRADFVLLVCTPTYRRRFDGAEEAGKGLGVTYEGLLITQEVYDAGSRNTRFIPVLLPGGLSDDVPIILRGSKWYEVPRSYDLLLRRLTGSDAVEPHPVGVPFSR